LRWAGIERFERRVYAFADELARTAPEDILDDLRWTAADRILWLALAAALGYGQHLVALRQSGLRLLAGASPYREHRSRSERRRLVGLLALWERWRSTGLWEPLRAALVADRRRSSRRRASPVAPFRPPARIMAANAIVPLATALAERARAVYLDLPGLPSNQTTRELSRQPGLTKHPGGAATQQGLRHLWAGWCYAQDCEHRPCNAHHDAHRQSQADTV
jgi:hypothetical protein